MPVNPRVFITSGVFAMEDYKASKEAFVSGMTGSSIGHVNMVSLVALVRPFRRLLFVFLTLPRPR